MHSYQTRSAVSGNVLLPGYDLSFPTKSIAFNGAHSYQTRSAVSENVLLPGYDLSFPKKSIAFNGAILWNKVPCTIKKAGSFDSFKNKPKTHHMKIQKEA